MNHKRFFKVPRAHQCLVVLSHVSVHFTLTWGLLFLHYLSGYLSNRIFICTPSIPLIVYPFIQLFVYPYIHLYSVYPSTHPSIRLIVYPFIQLFVYPYICLIFTFYIYFWYFLHKSSFICPNSANNTLKKTYITTGE